MKNITYVYCQFLTDSKFEQWFDAHLLQRYDRYETEMSLYVCMRDIESMVFTFIGSYYSQCILTIL